MKNLPELSFDTIRRMEDMSWFTHAQIFDDLLIVAQKETACFVLKTSDGLVVIDGIWPDARVYNEILLAISKGLSNEDIAAMLKLSVPRVKQLLNDLYARLGVANRAEAAATILREHLIG